jgi:signal transduction histidine kinase
LAGGGERIVIEAPQSLYTSIDPAQMRGAFANVIRNALAYSPPSSPVVVRVEDRGCVARVSIRDRGPSVLPEERAMIFEPFGRGRLPGSVRTGTGLGLFIARRVAEAHGGSIRLESSKVGALFCFEVPLGAEGRRASAS